jgi:hypothetical protein
MANFDLRRLAGEIAARHGIRLSTDDPALAIVTLNQLVLEETIQALGNHVRKTEELIDKAGLKVQARAGLILAQEVRQCASAIRQELQEGIDTASLRAQKNHSHGLHSKAPLYCSWPVGLFCVVIAFSFGILVGWTLHG